MCKTCEYITCTICEGTGLSPIQNTAMCSLQSEEPTFVVSQKVQAAMSASIPEGGSIIFHAGMSFDPSTPASLELKSNGEILINGKLAEIDKEVVDSFREWLRQARLTREDAIRFKREQLIAALQKQLGLEFPDPHDATWAQQLANIAIETWLA